MEGLFASPTVPFTTLWKYKILIFLKLVNEIESFSAKSIRNRSPQLPIFANPLLSSPSSAQSIPGFWKGWFPLQTELAHQFTRLSHKVANKSCNSLMYSVRVCNLVFGTQIFCFAKAYTSSIELKTLLEERSKLKTHGIFRVRVRCGVPHVTARFRCKEREVTSFRVAVHFLSLDI